MVVTLVLTLVSRLTAASSADLIGTWAVDGEATWNRLQSSPQIAGKLTGLPPDMIEQIKGTMLAQTAGTVFQFTNDTLISTSAGVKREEHFTISATKGEVLTADCRDDQGKTSQSTITVGRNQLEISNVADPTQVVVLKRSK
jgi:hypothetical protein